MADWTGTSSLVYVCLWEADESRGQQIADSCKLTAERFYSLNKTDFSSRGVWVGRQQRLALFAAGSYNSDMLSIRRY